MPNDDINTIETNGYVLKNPSKINIILGKNGCGKSRLLREVEKGLRSDENKDKFFISYITPERGGNMLLDPNVDQNINNGNWIHDNRGKNQCLNFKQQSFSKYIDLQLKVLMALEKKTDKVEAKNQGYNIKEEDKLSYYVKKLNLLLENVYIQNKERGFNFYLKKREESQQTKEEKPQQVEARSISSGESEIISLAIECLTFSKNIEKEKNNILFLDEPDVHIHPDLQNKFMNFLIYLVKDIDNFKIIIATHSTAILGAVTDYKDARVAFMGFNQKNIEFKEISDIYKKILPVFGAHPLSNLFNEKPIFLVEGEDDERIWQQAVRTSGGKIKIYPCVCGDVQTMHDFEIKVKDIINSVYNNAKAYSLRDRDTKPEYIDDFPPTIRFRLTCFSAENLLISDEVLKSLGKNWEHLKGKIGNWLITEGQKEIKHKYYDVMESFQESGYQRKEFDNLKDLRNILVNILESNKPWEVIVGQVIGNLTWDDDTDFKKKNSIYDYLSEKLVKNIIPKK